MNISRSTISRWIQNDIQFQTIENTKKINLPGQGIKSCFDEHEKEIIEYFYQLRSKKFTVNSTLLIQKIYSIKPDLKNNSYNSIRNILYRILKKNNITLRKATHSGQPLPENSFDKIYDFIYKIIKLRKDLNILDDTDNINRIINVDETSAYLELIPDKTYNLKGAKEVIIESKGQEKNMLQ